MDGIYRRRRMCTPPRLCVTQSVVTASAHLGQRDAISAVSTSFTGHVVLKAAGFRRLCVIAVHDLRPSFANGAIRVARARWPSSASSRSKSDEGRNQSAFQSAERCRRAQNITNMHDARKFVRHKMLITAGKAFPQRNRRLSRIREVDASG